MDIAIKIKVEIKVEKLAKPYLNIWKIATKQKIAQTKRKAKYKKRNIYNGIAILIINNITYTLMRLRD